MSRKNRPSPTFPGATQSEGSPPGAPPASVAGDEPLQSLDPPDAEDNEAAPGKTLDDILKDIGGAPTPPPPPPHEEYVRVPADPLLDPNIQITETPLTPESFTERAKRLADEGRGYIDHVNAQAAPRAPAQGLGAFANAELPQRVVAEPSVLSPALPEAQPGESYAQRISIVTAYPFVGQVHKAPDWVDRNWVAWDEASNGPALNVTDPEGNEIGRAVKGDYVCVQEVTMPDGHTTRRMAVIKGPEFDRLYRRA